MVDENLVSGLRRILEDNVAWDQISDVMLEMIHTKLHGLFQQIKTGEIEEPPFTIDDMMVIHQIVAKKLVNRGGLHVMPIDELDHTAEYDVLSAGMSEEESTKELSEGEEEEPEEEEPEDDEDVLSKLSDKYIFVPIDQAYTLKKALEDNINLEKGVDLFKPRKILKSSRVHGKSLFYNTGKSLEKMGEELFRVDEEYYVEQKFFGLPATIHKGPRQSKMYVNNRKDVSKSFKHILKEVKTLNDKSLIIVGSIVPLKNVEKGKKVNPSESQFIGWDILYHNGKSLHDTQLYERRKILASLNLNQFTNLMESPLMLVRDLTELTQAIAIASKVPKSNGAMIKDVRSIYPLDDSTDKWIEYREAEIVALNVSSITKTKNGFTYSLSVPADDKSVIQKGYMENGNIVLGDTYETQFEFDVGDKVYVAIEEIWKHKNKDGTRYRYSIHKPKILTSKPAATLISHVDLDKLSEDV